MVNWFYLIVILSANVPGFGLMNGILLTGRFNSDIFLRINILQVSWSWSWLVVKCFKFRARGETIAELELVDYFVSYDYAVNDVFRKHREN